MAEMRTIAVVTGHEAFGGILVSVLGRPGWRVRHFSSIKQLALYAGIARVDVVVLDLEMGEGGSVPKELTDLRDTHGQAMRVIVTTRSIAGWNRAMCRAQGIDEILLKPFSPVHLAERVRAHILALPKEEKAAGPAPAEVGPDWRNGSAPRMQGRTHKDTPNVVVLSEWRRMRARDDARH